MEFVSGRFFYAFYFLSTPLHVAWILAGEDLLLIAVLYSVYLEGKWSKQEQASVLLYDIQAQIYDTL
jgi:hypothetical protein